jgi:4-methyl-5(b-hydroxyethyl)-thiazole monophosphate biosynthesis
MVIYVMLGDGFEEIEAIAPIDVARRAGIDTVTVSVSKDLRVSSARGIIVIADKLLDEISVEREDMILLPGGKGVQVLESSARLMEMLKAHRSHRGWVAAICAAPSILGKLGILDGLRATCYPGYEKYLTSAHIADEDVVVDGNCITARGAGVSLAFAYEIVSVVKGCGEAMKLMGAMVYRGI